MRERTRALDAVVGLRAGASTATGAAVAGSAEHPDYKSSGVSASGGAGPGRNAGVALGEPKSRKRGVSYNVFSSP